MYVKRLKLKNFRNYEDISVEFANGTNIIYGNNAQGKTNLLEAIFLFCTARSHRRAADREIIMRGADFGVIDIEFCDNVRDYTGHMEILDGKKKLVTINNVGVKKISGIADYINVVMFSPEDLSIIKDSPSYRRRFCDMSLSQLLPAYVPTLNDYIKILNQRNNLLKDIKRGAAGIDTLDVWDSCLVDLCVKITKYRNSFIESMKEYAKKIHREISGEELEIKYISNSCDDASNEELIREGFEAKIAKSRMRDIETGATNSGCHRDDFMFFVNENDVRIYGSQGQQRSVVLSLKLALTELIRETRGENPVILLDDIMSELDESRRHYLAGKIEGKQVMITCTDREASKICDSSVKYFYVKGGSVREE